MRTMFLVTVAGAMTACGSSTPTSPTPSPVAITWTLSGTVTSSVSGFIAAATVAIVDGPDVGKQTPTDSAGRFSFAGLQQAGFSLRVSAPGFTAVARGITLTTNTVADFVLPRLPVAALTSEGPVGFTLRPDSAYDMAVTGVNTGDGCASAISGTTTLTGTTTATFPWALPPTTIVRPGDRFVYNFGPISRGDLAAFGASGTYFTRYTFTTTACP